jgi:hypothetical protein
MTRRLMMLLALAASAVSTPAQMQAPAAHGASKPMETAPFLLLHPADYQHYAQQFAVDEHEATGQQPPDAWPWMEANIPLFDSSDKAFEEMYYFRWYAWQKHVVQSKYGFLITEWLPKPDFADGSFGALPDAAFLHLGEARWLRDKRIASDYARYWLNPAASPRKYSFALADSVRAVTLATGDNQLGIDLLPALIDNYQAWKSSNYDTSVGLYWQIDTRDAMEKSISGDGYRTPLNSYQIADARAIAGFAAMADKHDIQTQYTATANALLKRMNERLWNSHDLFYETVSPAADSGIRKQKRFVDPGTVLQFSGVRELIGYIPWEFNLPDASRAVAWKQLFDPKGFAGKYGPTTAERRSPRFRFASSDQCAWNGPSWPFATTQTLLAVANLLNGPPQSSVTRQDYLQLFSNYVLSQHITLPSGRRIAWIDEDLDADTNEWIAKNMLIAKNKQVGRGNYYNHSGFTDPLVTGLIGLRPQESNMLNIAPLLPADAWSYFAIDGLPYHGHLLTIIYDRTGRHYGRGRGLMLFADGRKIASRATLGLLTAELSH